MASPKTPVEWMGRPVSHPDDVHDLDVRAAVNEFSSKMPRHEAEQKAYDSHVREKRLDAAAHHLAGAKAAGAAGQHEEARKHGVLYGLHCKAVGFDHVGPVPPEVAARMRPGAIKVHSFKAHPGDTYAIAEHESIVPLDKSEKKEDAAELAKESCDFTAKTTRERCKNPRSRKVAGRYLCHWHADLAAKEDKRAENLTKAEELGRLLEIAVKIFQ